jgi:hypothetical protein
MTRAVFRQDWYQEISNTFEQTSKLFVEELAGTVTV